ncbi:MAG: prepilin-type N-terminal cleavage/methylation domain-containing protein [Deferribacteraceae bacterium]|jgi:prepilin-type N-terminal cleavage/methylation domain-containing protein|nr:prepilin-type N-terminal cleavage/methylation domain-containing protein [Deferribacteraceae bacterium]
MKKGFSLVEVAIVLLCLGLLAVIVFRGGILIHSSEVRSEIGKMNKNATAISLYYSEINAIPGYDNVSSPSTDNATLGLLDIQDLLDQQYVTAFDLESKFSKNRWTYYHGIVPDTTVAAYTDINHPSDYPYRISTSARVIGLSIEDVEIRFLCSFEQIVDDHNFVNGNGRYFHGHVPTKNTPIDFRNTPGLFERCYKIKQDGAVEQYIRYAYVIFAY